MIAGLASCAMMCNLQGTLVDSRNQFDLFLCADPRLFKLNKSVRFWSKESNLICLWFELIVCGVFQTVLKLVTSFLRPFAWAFLLWTAFRQTYCWVLIILLFLGVTNYFFSTWLDVVFDFYDLEIQYFCKLRLQSINHNLICDSKSSDFKNQKF